MTDRPESAAFAYTGVDNLETMAAAVNYNAFLAALVAAELTPGDDILDFGAGIGTFALQFAAAGHRVVCVEPDPNLRATLSTAGLRCHASVNAIAPNSLDVVYAIDVLEHIEDDLGAVGQLPDRLKPRGKLLVYVPAFNCLYSSMDRKVGHVRRYRRAGLAAVLTKADLQIERIAYRDSLGFLASLAFKFVGRGDGTINERALVAYDRWAFPLSRRLDRVTGRWFGKNLWAIARRPV